MTDHARAYLYLIFKCGNIKNLVDLISGFNYNLINGTVNYEL